MKPETWLATLNCAVEGVIHAVRTQRHMRWHVLTAVTVLLAAPILAVSRIEFALLCVVIGMVVAAELVNTSLEAMVDLASPSFHPLAKVAKDVAAGAVLTSVFAAVAVGWVILFPKVEARVSTAVDALNQSQPTVVASVLLVVLVLVVYLKARIGRGTPLHGGFPSGHAAMSFAIATVLTLHTGDLLVGFFAVVLALMVGHSRMLLRIHSRGEVVAGGVLGCFAAAILYWLIS